MNDRNSPSSLVRPVLFLFILVCLVSLACNAPVRPQEPGGDATQAAQAAIETKVATLVNGQGTNTTPFPDAPQTQPANNSAPTRSAPTQRPSGPTATQSIPSPTPTCDQAAFVADVNVPDGTTITAGTAFTKTWRLQNKGTCTWTPEYTLIFDSGDRMEGPDAQKINASVAPGQTVDVSVPLRAPGSPGTYKGTWKLRNAANVLFGIGPAKDGFYLEINVIAPINTSAGFDFIEHVCLAQWTGNDKSIPCTGKEGDADGFVQTIKRPILEGGYVDDEPALLTYPPRAENSTIRGKFPGYTVREGDHFLSHVSCEHNQKNCSVRFQLEYQLDNGPIQTLATWNETHDSSFNTVNVDLNSLVGKTVQFILTVSSNGATDQDRALWLLPRIKKE